MFFSCWDDFGDGKGRQFNRAELDVRKETEPCVGSSHGEIRQPTNNYPWPTPDESQQAAIAGQAQAILDARAVHPGKSLAWLYNPETMPDNLKAAHAALDAAVDAAYAYQGKKDDATRVAFLFKRYQALTAPKAK
jgi:hypothetical protein